MGRPCCSRDLVGMKIQGDEGFFLPATVCNSSVHRMVQHSFGSLCNTTYSFSGVKCSSVKRAALLKMPEILQFDIAYPRMHLGQGL